jgi:ubiquinone/menaquinone biosynthesis C-methylase UbiE
MSNPDPRIAYFNDLAARWDQQEPSAEAMVQHLERHADLLRLRPGEALLEVGCGTGKTTGHLVDRVGPNRVTAIDFAPAMVDAARGKAIPASFRCADVCRDDLGTAAYDVILCFHSFPHFRDQAAALCRLASALRPTGRLLVMHMVGREPLNRFHGQLNGPVRGDRLPDADTWEALLNRAGLQLAQWIDRDDLFFLEAIPVHSPAVC